MAMQINTSNGKSHINGNLGGLQNIECGGHCHPRILSNYEIF